MQQARANATLCTTTSCTTVPPVGLPPLALALAACRHGWRCSRMGEQRLAAGIVVAGVVDNDGKAVNQPPLPCTSSTRAVEREQCSPQQRWQASSLSQHTSLGESSLGSQQMAIMQAHLYASNCLKPARSQQARQQAQCLHGSVHQRGINGNTSTATCRG